MSERFNTIRDDNLADMKPGQVSWQSPSNIAIIKYWGKHGIQLPRNPNISFTLDQAHTQTSIEYSLKEGHGDEVDFSFLFDGQPNAAFHKRISSYLNSLTADLSFLKQVHLKISSTNSFPHSSGIASSASAMSALALCLCSIEQQLLKNPLDSDDFYKKASYLARLGSGSAARSVFPYASTWGTSKSYPGSDDTYAIGAEDNLHSSFKTIQDTILLVSKFEKSVSSSAGHALMDGNPFAEIRYAKAHERLALLKTALWQGDWVTFGVITEQEALDLHALMMTSDPSYILIEPNTLEVINRIRAYREKHHIPVYFTLDAGPNVHILYPKKHKGILLAFIDKDLSPYAQQGEYIIDHAGPGPKQLI